MAVTTPGAYLLIARYNREKWNSLKKPTADAGTATLAVGAAGDQDPVPTPDTEEPRIDEQEQAHECAEEMFPEDHYPLPQLTPEERDRLPPPQTLVPPDLKGVRMLHSFHTNLFAWIYEKIPDIEGPGEDKPASTLGEGDAEPKTPGQIIDEMMMPPGTGQKDPGIGWLAVVDAGDFTAFVDKMGGESGPLWRMYDTEVIPLNNDQTTWDVYNFMTAVNWS